MSNPFSPALTDLAHLLAPFGGAAVAIVLITLLVRVALHPLTRVAVRGERARARLQPQIARLRARHGTDLTRFGQEMAALHKKEKISPFAGFGPMLLQAPIFLVLYRAATSGSFGAARLFGVPLSTRFVASVGALGVHLAIFGALFLILIAVAVFTSRRAARLADPGAPAMMRTIAKVAPFLVLISAAVLPLAAGLYLVTTTSWSAAENALLKRGVPTV